MAKGWDYKWSLVLANVLTVGGALLFTSQALAQNITLDGTLGAKETLTGANYIIPQSAGQTVGNNLFHSFGKFNLNANEAAIFQSADNIRNILSRVTGGEKSLIDGLIRTQSGVNLFFINPSGIIFGQNARLDVGGSFVATTANAIQFGNLGLFSATEKNVPSPLLTINPSALFFNQINPAPIVNNSIARAGRDPAGFNVFGLRVPDGKSLLLVGGNVTMDGGQLNAYGGRVELGGLASPGNINLLVNGNDLRLDFPKNATFADVSLNNRASVYVEAAGGGNITVNARNLEILRRSELSAGVGQGLGTPETVAGDITLNASGEIKVASSSRIANFVSPRGKGNGGNITIDSVSFSLQDGAQLTTSTYGQGNAGNVTVHTKDTVFLTGKAYIFTDVQTGAVGNGGNITIDSASLSLQDGAQLAASTFGQGNGGNVTVLAKDAVSLAGQETAILSTVEAGGVGNGGNIDINAATLSLIDAAQLLTITRGESDTQPAGQGNAGNVNIQVTGKVDIAGQQNRVESGIASTVETGTVGNGGNITIDSSSFSLRDGAVLSAFTDGQGNAGNIRINAKDAVTVSGTSQESGYSSALFTFTDFNSTGKGGNITITTNIFRILNGALLDASTTNDQKGGDITVNANIFEALNGGQLSATTQLGNGRAGKITVNATDKVIISGSDSNYNDRIAKFSNNIVLNISANSGLFVSSTGSGITGDIEVNSPKITLDNQGKLNADSASGNGGNININSDLLLLRRNSQISTNAGTEQKGGDGGNININSKFIVAVPNENSDISANAFTGAGGKVTINATGIYGITPRSREDLVRLLGTSKSEDLDPAKLSTSDITAISQTSPTLNGDIILNTPDTDPSRGLTQLPINLVDVSQQIVQGCRPRGKTASHFISTGRGGLPLSPDEPLRERAVITNWVTLGEGNEKIEVTKQPTPETIVEAQGWVRDANGNVELVAHVSEGGGRELQSALSCDTATSR